MQIPPPQSVNIVIQGTPQAPSAYAQSASAPLSGRVAATPEFDFAAAFSYDKPIQTDFTINENFVVNALAAAYQQYLPHIPEIAAEKNFYLMGEKEILMGKKRFLPLKEIIDPESENITIPMIDEKGNKILFNEDNFNAMLADTNCIEMKSPYDSPEGLALGLAIQNVYGRIQGQVGKQILQADPKLATSNLFSQTRQQSLRLMGAAISLLESASTNEKQKSNVVKLPFQASDYADQLAQLITIKNFSVTHQKSYPLAYGEITPNADEPSESTIAMQTLKVDYEAESGEVKGAAQLVDIHTWHLLARHHNDWSAIPADIIADNFTDDFVLKAMPAQQFEKPDIDTGTLEALERQKAEFDADPDKYTKMKNELKDGEEITNFDRSCKVDLLMNLRRVTKDPKEDFFYSTKKQLSYQSNDPEAKPEDDKTSIELSENYGLPILEGYLNTRFFGALPVKFDPAKPEAPPWMPPAPTEKKDNAAAPKPPALGNAAP